MLYLVLGFEVLFLFISMEIVVCNSVFYLEVWVQKEFVGWLGLGWGFNYFVFSVMEKKSFILGLCEWKWEVIFNLEFMVLLVI